VLTRLRIAARARQICYYTRNMNDFGPRGYHVFDCVVKKQASGLVAARRCPVPL
jgi:hypothetical protein